MTRKTKPENEVVEPGAGRRQPGPADVARILAAGAVVAGVLYTALPHHRAEPGAGHSEAVIVTEEGGEILSKLPRELAIR